MDCRAGHPKNKATQMLRQFDFLNKRAAVAGWLLGWNTFAGAKLDLVIAVAPQAVFLLFSTVIVQFEGDRRMRGTTWAWWK